MVVSRQSVSGNVPSLVSHASGLDVEKKSESSLQDMVHIGDLVMLMLRKGDQKCILRGEGVVKEDVHVFTVKDGDPAAGRLIGDVRDCLFRVVPQMSYNSHKELTKYKASSDEQKHTSLEELEEKVKQEEIQNEARKDNKSQVRYGDVVQLQHVKSGKYLTIMPKQTARMERDARRVCLQHGGMYSAFLTQPFYKYKAVGDPLLFDEQVLLSSQKLGPRWIFHAALNDDHQLPESIPGSTLYEANCSTDDSGCFYPVLYSRGTSNLQCGHLIRILYPQNDLVLGASCTLDKAKRPFLRRREQEKPTSLEGLWAKGIWLIESPKALQGGNIKWGKREEIRYTSTDYVNPTAVCLRHMGTGLYLSVDKDAKPEMSGKRGNDARLGRLVKEQDSTCYFLFDVLENDVPGQDVELSGRGQVKALLRFDTLLDDEECSLWFGSEERAYKKVDDMRPRPSLEVHWGKARRIRDAMIIECFNCTRPAFADAVTQVLSWKATFLKCTERLQGHQRPMRDAAKARQSQKRDKLQEESFHLSIDVIEEVHTAVSHAIRFLTEQPDLEDCLECKKKSWSFAQRVMREVKLLDASVRLMDTLWEAGYKVTELRSRTVFKLEGVNDKKVTKPDPNHINSKEERCLKLIIELWRCSFQDNRESENYFFSKGWLEKINMKNGLGLGAANCLSALVSNNKKLLQGVSQETLQMFIDFIGKLGPDHTWLEFMSAVCSCEGQAIANKQQQVLQMMYWPGTYCKPADLKKWGHNRVNLFLGCSLSPQAKMPLPESVLSNVAGAGDIPGNDIVQNGIRDIWISWHTSTEPWEMNKDWLFFHPNHLGLPVRSKTKLTLKAHNETVEQHWVSLSDVAWVLDPECTYAYVHPDQPPKAWANSGSDIKKLGKYRGKQLLAKYLVSQIQVMREMCLDNQVNSMQALQTEYSFDMLSCAICDHTLPPEVRQVFCSFMTSLWITRHPHLEQPLVPLCHVWDKLCQTKAGQIWLPQFNLIERTMEGFDSTTFDRFPTHRKFNMLLGYAKHHLVCMQGTMVHKHTGAMAYTGEIVAMSLQLLRYGFVGEVELAQILHPLVACLDGRTDWLDCPVINLEATGGQVPDDFSPSFQDDTVDQDSTSPLLCSPKKSSRPRQTGSLNGGRGPLYLGIPNPADGPQRYTKEKGHKSSLVHTKVVMCDFCATVLDIAVGNGVEQLARLFAEWKKKRPEGLDGEELGKQDVQRIVDMISPPLFDFDKICGSNFNTLLIDLMMYDHADLFVGASNVMRLWNCRLGSVLDQATDLIMLAEKHDISDWGEMQYSVAMLAHLINTSEDWSIDSPLGPIDRSKFDAAMKLLEKIRFVCSIGDIDSEVPNNRIQAILSSLRLGEELMRTFDIPYDDFAAASEGMLKDFMVSVCMLLHQFVFGMPKNQRFFHTRLKKLSEWAGKDIGIAYAIAGIFRNNRALCETLSEDIVYDVGRTLVQTRRAGLNFLPQRLDFLQAIIVAGQRPIVRNKEMLLRMLKNPYYAPVLHLLDDPNGMKHRQDLLRRFKSWNELEKPAMLRKWNKDDGELQYHNRTYKLLSQLCLGRDESGASAFVQSKCPAKQLCMGYMSINEVQQSGCSQACDFMCTAMKTTMLEIVDNVYYDTELKDEVFFASTRHYEFLEQLFVELSQLKDFMASRTLQKVEEEFLFQLLRNFNALLEHTPSKKWHTDIQKLLMERLQPLLVELGTDQYKVAHQNTFFKMATSRLLGWLRNDADLKHQRLIEMPEDDQNRDQSRELTAEVQKFMTDLKENEHIKAALHDEKQVMIEALCGIYTHTNVADLAYQKEKEQATAEGRPIKGGFRRNPIFTSTIMERFISHCLEDDHLKQWETTHFVIDCVCEVLQSKQADPAGLAAMQLLCAHGGAERLVIDTLCGRPEPQVVQSALRLAQLLLKPNNKEVQDVFVAYFYSVDDYQLWQLFTEMIEAVRSTVKHVRNLKKIHRDSGKERHEVLTTEECQNIAVYQQKIQTLEEALQFLQLLCEGHNEPVQKYIFQQVDNSLSINILEKLKNLCLKISKNETAADLCDPQDIDVMTTCFEVLNEVTTRPDPRNQLFLSTSGIVEGVMKMISARFLVLRTQAEEESDDEDAQLLGPDEPLDCYPRLVRRLKGQVTLLLLTLLELRQDNEVHRTILIRTDFNLLRRRLIFTHRWFLASRHKLGKRPHICNDEGMCQLDEYTQDDAIIVPDCPPMDLLPGYREENLLDLFEEAFNIMLIIKQLQPHDQKFRTALTPKFTEFDKSLELRVSPDAFRKAQTDYRTQCKYNEAYTFYNMWIKMVEVLVDGRVHDLYFRMPVLCHYVLGSEKEKIQNEVTIESPEAKVKEFVNRCVGLFQMTQHTRDLSQWSPKLLAWVSWINGGHRIRPLLFFLKEDSKNLTNLTVVCLMLAVVLNGLIYKGLELDPTEQGDEHALPKILDRNWRLATFSAGVLYTVFITVQLTVVCLTYTPMDYDKIMQGSSQENRRIGETILFLLCFPVVIVLRLFRILHASSAVVVPISIFLLFGSWWQPGWGRCPRNWIAQATATAYASIQRQVIFRRVMLVVMAVCGVVKLEFFYTFLLLDVMFIFSKLQNIIKAVTDPIVSLGLTMLVGIILMYEYAVIAFFYYRKDYNMDGADTCTNMADCTMMTIYLGMREDIGQSIAGVNPSQRNSSDPQFALDQEHFYGRVIFDLSFFVLITTIGMNILFGIIVDTFGSLRDQVHERETYKKRTTFIASLERSDIDKSARAVGIPSGFDYLENDRQCQWNYMNFIFYLKRKDKINYAGPETLINKFICDEDISWLPLYTCTLQQSQREAEAEKEARKAAVASRG